MRTTTSIGTRVCWDIDGPPPILDAGFLAAGMRTTASIGTHVCWDMNT